MIEAAIRIPMPLRSFTAGVDEVKLQAGTVGEAMVEGHQSGQAADEEAAAAVGAELADRLLADGAGAILSGARAAGAPRASFRARRR